MTENKKFFIGIDLGGKEKKSTGICILEGCQKQKCEEVFGREVLKKISPYLKETEVIGIDAPLTLGRGKGKMRLYEKFLSQKVFKEAKVSPIPPALMSSFCEFALELRKKLEKRGFVLGINLIETFPTLVKKICKMGSVPNHQKSALLCARIAFLHSQFKTRWLGYKDGFLFLPQMSFWEKSWQKKFYQVWQERHRLKYKHLITNIFS